MPGAVAAALFHVGGDSTYVSSSWFLPVFLLLLLPAPEDRPDLARWRQAAVLPVLVIVLVESGLGIRGTRVYLWAMPGLVPLAMALGWHRIGAWAWAVGLLSVGLSLPPIAAFHEVSRQQDARARAEAAQAQCEGPVAVWPAAYLAAVLTQRGTYDAEGFVRSRGRDPTGAFLALTPHEARPPQVRCVLLAQRDPGVEESPALAGCVPDPTDPAAGVWRCAMPGSPPGAPRGHLPRSGTPLDPPP